MVVYKETLRRRIYNCDVKIKHDVRANGERRRPGQHAQGSVHPAA